MNAVEYTPMYTVEDIRKLEDACDRPESKESYRILREGKEALQRVKEVFREFRETDEVYARQYELRRRQIEKETT